MARIPLVTRDDVPEGEQGAHDELLKRRGDRPLAGPYALLLRMPELTHRLEALRTYLRDEPSLPQKLQELVMLTVAREMDCAFIWYAHATAARQAGVRDDIVDGIRERREPTDLDPDENGACPVTADASWCPGRAPRS